MSQKSNAWICEKLRTDLILMLLVGRGSVSYIFQDECNNSSNWTEGNAYINSLTVPGQLFIALPSSPPSINEAVSSIINVDLDTYPIIKFNIPEVRGPYFEWRFGVRIASIDYFFTSWNNAGEGTYELNAKILTGLSGSVSMQLVFDLRYNGGFPSAFSTWIMLDYIYIQSLGDPVQDEIIIAEPYDRPELLETTPAMIVVRPESETPETFGSQLGREDATIYIEARSWTKQTVHDIKKRVKTLLGDVAGELSDGGHVNRVRYDWGRDPYLNEDGKTYETQLRFIINQKKGD